MDEITPVEGTVKPVEESKDDLAENYKTAMYAERTKAKELLAQKAEMELKIAEYAKKEAEEMEKEKLKKGKYEEVIAEQKAKLDELEKKASAYDKFIDEQKTKLDAEFTKLSEQLPEETRTKYEPIVSKLSLEDKVSFYNNLISDVKKDDFKQTPNAGGQQEFNQLDKSKGFDSYMAQLLTINN